MSNPKKLPLHYSCYLEMRDRGLEENQFWPIEFFEKQLGHPKIIGPVITEVRKHLEYDGWVLSGRGMKGRGYMLLKREDNEEHSINKERAAGRTMKRQSILLLNTPTDKLSPEKKKSLRRTTERILFKTALMIRNCKNIDEGMKMARGFLKDKEEGKDIDDDASGSMSILK